jgi:hypothetical protein
LHIGKWLFVKHENKILKGTVKKIYEEDLDIRLEDETIIRRKFWEVRAIEKDNSQEEIK